MNDDFMFEDEMNQESSGEYDYTNPEPSREYNYTNPEPSGEYNYTNPEQPHSQKQTGTGLATASMVLGIVSLVLFCCCLNVFTGILAIVFGIIYLTSYDLSVGKYRAIAGIVTASISIALLIAGYVMISDNKNISRFLEDDYFREFYNEYNSDDFGNRDYLDDEYLDIEEFFGNKESDNTL